VKKTLVTVAAMAFSAAALAPVAHADGLGGVSGWQPSPAVCGSASLMPVIVTNASQIEQTGSVTVASQLAANVQLFTTYGGAQNAQGCQRSEMATFPGYSYNFTVPAGGQTTFWAVLGGVDENDIGNSHNIAFGGLASGTSGQGWFNMELQMNGMQSFTGLQSNYSGTGGTNGSNQNNFNLVKCTVNSAGNTVPTPTILTPYTSGDANGPWYGKGQAICAGWFPQGTMVPFNAVNAAGTTIQADAAQLNAGTLAFAGYSTFGAPGPGSMTVYYSGSSLPVYTPVIYSGYDSASGNTTWAVDDIPLPTSGSGSATLYYNGYPLATYSY